MNGVFHNLKLAFLAGTFLSMPAHAAESKAAHIPLEFAQSAMAVDETDTGGDVSEMPALPPLDMDGEVVDTGSMSLEDLPPPPSGMEEPASEAAAPAPDVAPASAPVAGDNRVFSFEEPLEDDNGPSIIEDLAPPPPSIEADADMEADMDMDATMSDSELDALEMPALPGEKTPAQQAAQQAEDRKSVV